MSGSTSTKTKRSSFSPYLSIHSLPMYNIMNNLILIKKLHQQNILILKEQTLQKLQSYHKMLKTVGGYICKNNQSVLKHQKRSSYTKTQQRGSNSRSPLMKKRDKLAKCQQLKFDFEDHEKIDEKKITELEAYKIFKGLFGVIEDQIKQWMFQFRLQTTDMIALLTKYKFTDDFLSRKSYETIQQIMEKYSMTINEKSSAFLHSPLSELFQQKSEFLSHSVGTLILKAQNIFESLPYYKQLQKQKKFTKQFINLKQILFSIAKEYDVVPYHNFSHGFAVFASFFDLTQVQGISRYFDNFSLFYGLIACLAHDVGHPGNNTLFQVKIKSELAIDYCNVSVMEKMHLSKTMKILSRNTDTSKLFNELPQNQQNRVRKLISSAILATDMMKHYTYLEKLNQLVEKKEIYQTSNSQEENSLVMEILVHCCDIQNPSYPYDCYLQWANLVCMEFHMQAIKQSVLRVEVTPFMKFDSLPYFYRNQISFVTSTVLPIWQSLERKFMDLNKKKITEQIRNNLQMLTAAIRRNSGKSGSNVINSRGGNRIEKIEEFVGGRIKDYIEIQRITNLEKTDN